jgi:hypothetical protein
MSKTNQQLREENAAIQETLAAGPEKQLRTIPGVVHVSVGLKEKNGKLTDQLCIRVYVKEKKSSQQVPLAERIPSQINGIPTDVHIVRQFFFATDNSLYRPIHGGIQISNRIIGLSEDGTHTQISRGTLGCCATDSTDKAAVLLGNWHVLYANAARDGDKVFQPAPTSIPDTDLADLPVRPQDDTNKIGVLRRSVISEKVDCAIATIDVSSCCHCCGIHYSNELTGLSVAAKPPRNTIQGDEPAVSGMSVFKVGQSSLRTEGVVSDANYPAFSITKFGTTYTFSGQMAIQNVDPTVPFAVHGDSGSVVINLNNKIVGLYFASEADAPFTALANHISDVFTALNISIPYSPDVVVTSGETLTDRPDTVDTPPLPEAYSVLRDRLQRHENTAALFALGDRHRMEMTYLINHCRPVTVSWHRSHGPALLAAVMAAVRDGHYRLPATIHGLAPYEILTRMRTVVSEHCTPELKEAMDAGSLLLEMCRGCNDLNELIERIADDEGLSSVLQQVTS